jgi:hypothetical protein
MPAAPAPFKPGDSITAAKLNRMQAGRVGSVRGVGVLARSRADELQLVAAFYRRFGPRVVPATITAKYGTANATYDASSIFGNVKVAGATPINRIFPAALVVHLPAAVGAKCLLWSDGQSETDGGAVYHLVVWEQVDVAQCESSLDGGEWT